MKVEDGFINIAPVIDPNAFMCSATIQLTSLTRAVDGLPPPAGLFVFNDLINASIGFLGLASLDAMALTFPYNLDDTGLYNVALYYKVGMLEYTVSFTVYLLDPCEALDPVLDPVWKDIVFTLNPDYVANNSTTFDLQMPAGFEYCLYDGNTQLTLTMGP